MESSVANLEGTAEKAAHRLRDDLGDNLVSCSLYGSIIRGDATPASSVNLLIVLRKSDAAAHTRIATLIKEHSEIDPMIISADSFERTVEAFGAKFSSIKRNYRLLYGQDILAGISIEPRHERFLCEQALRNLRLRLGFAFVKNRPGEKYVAFVAKNAVTFFVHASEALRLTPRTVELPPDDLPRPFTDRIPVLAARFSLSPEFLRNLLALRRRAANNLAYDPTALHDSMISAVDQVLKWTEAHWHESGAASPP